MGRTMQISNPVRGPGRKHVIGTSMSSRKRSAGRRNTLSQEDYSIFSPVLCPAVVSWVKDPDCAGQSVEEIVLAGNPAKPREVMSDRSFQGETDFQDAVTDFQESVDSPALWKEIHADISTHTPELEQMHPHPVRPRSPNNSFLERINNNPGHGHGSLTPDKTSPDLSGHLQSGDQSVDSSTNVSVRTAMKSPRSKYMIPSTSPDERYPRERASVANSPQHLGGTTSPIAQLKPNFGWLTPTRTHTRGASAPRSPEFAKPPLPLRNSSMMSPSHMPPAKESWSPPQTTTKSTRSATTMKLKRQQAKLQEQQQQQQQQQQHEKGSTSPSDISISSNVTVEKAEKSPGKRWKNLSRSISPMFAGKRSETSRSIGKDLGNSFRGSKRRSPSRPGASAPVATWSNDPVSNAPVASLSRSGSGDGSVITPESEKEPSGGDDGYPPQELTRNGSMNIKSTKSHGMFNFLGWGRKKTHGAKVNELFQNVEPGTAKGTVKLDSNSFKVMDYTIKTLQFKLEQAKKNELATANEFKALQLAMDAAEGKCNQLQQRCHELETELVQLQAETKVVELDYYEIAKHRGNNGLNKGSSCFPTLEVAPQLFQKTLEDAKLSIKKLASALCTHIREGGESATHVITSLLEQQKDASGWVSKMPRNVIILYFESFLNQVLFESFENVSFEPNGTSPVCDPDALKSACCKAFHELRRQEWATIEKSLGKVGSTIVNPTFHRFFVLRMELILSQLTQVADKETSLALLATFFNAFKSVWLLHHLAFAHDTIPVTIFRISVGSDFDPRFMEQVTTLEEDASCSKISVMVNPGFLVNHHTIKCQVFCSSKYQ